MTFLLQLHNKIKGFGLFEILISLALFAGGVVAVTSLNVKTYKIIKNNELADFADRTMVKSLEYFKTPTTSGVQSILEGWMTNASNIDKIVEVSIDTASIIDDSLPLIFKFQSFPSLPLRPLSDLNPSFIKTCEAGSLFKITTSSTSLYKDFDICEQVIIEKKTNGYKITSTVVYKIDIGVKINQIIGYRPFTYEGN